MEFPEKLFGGVKCSEKVKGDAEVQGVEVEGRDLEEVLVEIEVEVLEDLLDVSDSILHIPVVELHSLLAVLYPFRTCVR